MKVEIHRIDNANLKLYSLESFDTFVIVCNYHLSLDQSLFPSPDYSMSLSLSTMIDVPCLPGH